MNNIYVRVRDSLVVEVFVNTTTLTILELFHVDLASQFEACSTNGVEVGWIKRQDGTFAPPPPSAPETIPVTQV